MTSTRLPQQSTSLLQTQTSLSNLLSPGSPRGNNVNQSITASNVNVVNTTTSTTASTALPQSNSDSGNSSNNNNNNKEESNNLMQQFESYSTPLSTASSSASNSIQSSPSNSFNLQISNTSNMAAEEKMEKLKDITTKTIDNIIFKITEMKREKQFLQSFKDIMKISESLVEIERTLESITDINGNSSSSQEAKPSDSASELIKIIHSRATSKSKRGSKLQDRSINSIDSLHSIIQQCLDTIKTKVLIMKKQLVNEQSANTVLKYGEIIRNIRNQLNSFRTLSLPESIVLVDGEKIHLKVSNTRFHLYDNSSNSNNNNSSSKDLKEPIKFEQRVMPGSGSNQTNYITTTTDSTEEEFINGTLYVTNYQIIFYGHWINQQPFKKSFSLQAITKMSKSGKRKSSSENSYRLIFQIKDGRTLSISFYTNPNTNGQNTNQNNQPNSIELKEKKNPLKDVRDCIESILESSSSSTYPSSASSSAPSSSITSSLFCFQYKLEYQQVYESNLGWNIYNATDEYARMGIPAPDWKFNHSNSTYYLCDTYPSLLVVPTSVSDEQLKNIAQFRSRGRLPALSYRHWSNKASITRCSQPRVGISRNRCEDDEFMLNAIRNTGPGGMLDKQLYIIDARPYANAVGNRAKGAGWEILDNYQGCTIEFMNIANIHVMRHSLIKVREAVGTCSIGNRESTYLTALDASGWMEHIKLVMVGAVRIARLIQLQHSNVLVHCSDGWDRTSQLTSLAQLMLDPYYRTIRGFEILIEKEWLSFGHKFSQRCGQVNGKDEDERAPIFIQFLECVYQMHIQFPGRFEFNTHFLKTIYTHTYSGLYGNFLYNTERERVQNHTMGKTLSLWLEIDRTLADHINPLYQPSEREVIFPDCSLKRLRIWRQIYHNQLSDTDYYEPEEKLIRMAFEKQIQERVNIIKAQYPLVPYRTHTASISQRITTNFSIQALNNAGVISASGNSQSTKKLEDLDNNLIIDNVSQVESIKLRSTVSSLNLTTPKSSSQQPQQNSNNNSSSPDTKNNLNINSSASTSSPSSSGQQDQSNTNNNNSTSGIDTTPQDKKKIVNGFNSLSRGLFKKK